MDNFWSAFLKQAQEGEKEMVDKNGRKHVAAVAVIHDDKLLMGKRRDNGKWTQPGGHMNEGEDPTSGAIRELMEEAGMTANSMKHLATENVTTPTGKKYVIHAFKATVKDPSTSMKEDPDQEVHRWHWVSFKDGIKKEIWANMHVPPENNIVFKALGIKGAEEEEKKAEITNPLAYALMGSVDDMIRFGNMLARSREDGKKRQEQGKQVPRSSHPRNN